MSAYVVVGIGYLGVWLVLGVIALCKADRKDVVAVVRALGRWGRR